MPIRPGLNLEFSRYHNMSYEKMTLIEALKVVWQAK
jgi:hypothetical protein